MYQKTKRIRYAGILMGMLVLFAGACHFSDTVGNTAMIDGMSVSKDRLTIPAGGSDMVTLKIDPAEMQREAKVSWSVEDTEIAQVTGDNYSAVIYGLVQGTTAVTVSCDGITRRILVAVEGYAENYEEEPYLYSETSVVQLQLGESLDVHVSMMGASPGELENITWEIANPEVAEITAGGNDCVITAKKTGATQLIARHSEAAFPYHMVVFVYTDTFEEPYLTTASNLITINTAESDERTISVELMNPYTATWQQECHWEIIDEAETGGITLNPNGNTALISAHKSGLYRVQVSNDGALYPLDILVRVITAVKNVYIVPSETTVILDGGADGQTVRKTITAKLAGYDGQADESQFEWEFEEDPTDILDFEAVGSSITITGKKNGTAKLHVSHPLASLDRTILVMLTRQPGSAVSAEMYITTSSNYVQTQVGADTVDITVSLVGGEPGDENGFIWKIDKGADNEVCFIETTTGRVEARGVLASRSEGILHITPKSVGEARVIVSHPKVLYETEILIKVYSEYAQLTEPLYIKSDVSLIRLVNGKEQEVRVALEGAAEPGDEAAIHWESADAGKVSVTPASGDTVMLRASGSGQGQTYVTVSHPEAQSEKKILVLTADTQEELDAMKALYAGETYHRMNVGDQITLSANQVGLEESDVDLIKWSVDKPELCGVVPDSANSPDSIQAFVTGYASGEATITASLDGCAPLEYSVIILPEGEDTGVIEAAYLTTKQNAIVIPAVGETGELAVTGIGISDADMLTTHWEEYGEDGAAPGIADVYSANGKTATVTANEIGKTKVRVTNDKSANDLLFDVKVGALYEWTDDMLVYITTDTDVVQLVTGESFTIGAQLVNSQDQGAFYFNCSDTGIAQATGSTQGTCIIKAASAGQAKLTIRNDLAVAEKEVLIVVDNSAEELAGFKYLTTEQNVVTVGEGSNVTVNVEVVNAAHNVTSGFSWISDDPDVVSVSSAGATAVFYGHRMGTTKVTVRNDQCDYPLEIIVNTVDMALASEYPYIMTASSIVRAAVGDDPVSVNAELIGGSAADNHAFTFAAADPGMLQVYAANETAELKALKEGVTQLIISHPKAQGIDRTILVICEPERATNCTIDIGSSAIITMRPTDREHVITASLIGGDANDVYDFVWWADDYSTIDLSVTANQAVITPLASGITNVHVSHPKAKLQRDIVVVVQQYDEFNFEVQYVDTTAGTRSFVNMEIPASNVKTTIAYSSSNPDVVSASGSEVCILEARNPGTATITAVLKAQATGVEQARCELLVNVAEAPLNLTYISFPEETIMSIERKVTKTLSATLAGTNAQTGDSESIQWINNNPDVISIAPASASGIVTNSQCQVTALKAGNATITVTHEKANQPLELYIIVPGDNAATITLNKTAVNMILGSDAQTLAATIKNAQEGDYEHIEWSVPDQDDDDPVITITGEGKQIAFQAAKPGNATIQAVVPSSRATALCTVTVEEARTLTLEYESINLYPGGELEVAYTITPATDTIKQWQTSDSAYFEIIDQGHDAQGSGTLLIIGKGTEGIASITGVTSSAARATMQVSTQWNYLLTLGKNYINTIPVNNGDGTWDIAYEVRPACSELEITFDKRAGLEVLNAENKSDAAGTKYVIKDHENIDPVTGIATGTIHFDVTGEMNLSNNQAGNGVVQINAWNPLGGGTDVDDKPVGEYGKQQTMQILAYYDSYNFDILNFTSDGAYSRWDSSTGCIIIGDGETARFTLDANEAANPNHSFVSAALVTSSLNTNNNNRWPIGSADANDKVTVSAAGTGKNFSITHKTDFIESSSVEQTNTTVKAEYYMGYIQFRYQNYNGDTRTYDVPVYVEARTCAKDYR